MRLVVVALFKGKKNKERCQPCEPSSSLFIIPNSQFKLVKLKKEKLEKEEDGTHVGLGGELNYDDTWPVTRGSDVMESKALASASQHNDWDYSSFIINLNLKSNNPFCFSSYII